MGWVVLGGKKQCRARHKHMGQCCKGNKTKKKENARVKHNKSLHEGNSEIQRKGSANH